MKPSLNNAQLNTKHVTLKLSVKIQVHSLSHTQKKAADLQSVDKGKGHSSTGRGGPRGSR